MVITSFLWFHGFGPHLKRVASGWAKVIKNSKFDHDGEILVVGGL